MTPRITRFVIGCSIIPIAVAAIALAGWILGSDHLRGVLPGFIAMNPLTAICFMLCGIALWRQRSAAATSDETNNFVATAFGITVALVGGLKVASYVFRFDLPIDRIMFAGSLGDNRMAPNTALCFLLIGTALASIDRITKHGFWPAQILTVVVATVSLVSLVGYSYGATSLYQMAAYVPMALNTAAAFGVLAIGVLFARPDRGMLAVILDPGPGGVMCRRLLPAVFLAPCLLGWFRIFGEQLGLYDTEFGTALIVSVTVMFFTVAVGWIASALNHTDAERRAATIELIRKSEEVYDLYNTAPCGYHSLDENGVFIRINDTELKWLGYTRDEIVGKLSFADLLQPHDISQFAIRYPRFKQEGSVRDLDFELLRKDGTKFPVILNSTAVRDANGCYVCSRTTLFDATERRRHEEALKQFNDELEQRVEDRTTQLAAANADLLQKNEENELFVYSVSHDLRSPLVNLQGFSQELATALPTLREMIAASNLPPEQESRGLALIDADMRQSIRFIQSAVSRLSGIIDALLRLSRAGRVEYQPQSVDTNRVVTRIVESMSSTIFDRGVAVDVKPLPECWGDSTAVEQVFANLIGNSVKYLDPTRPGQIEVGALPPRTGADAVQHATTYYVKDNGLGIDPVFHGKVFQALKRLHPDVAEGEGIGLAIVKRIVDRHGGTITFESAAGAGATFFVTLPNPATLASDAPAVFHEFSPVATAPEDEHERSIGIAISGR